MSKIKFKSTKKNKFNFIKENNEIFNTDIIKNARTEIFSNKRIIIEGCKKIVEYQDNYIKLQLKNSFINILGTNFKITTFEENKIEINGNILTIEFCV